MKKAEEKLEEAVLNLSSQATFEAMSVSKIAEVAGVNRVTFYRHFNDKWELLEQIEGRFFETLSPLVLEMLALLHAPKSDEECQAALQAFLEQFQEKLELFKALSKMDLGFSDKFFRFLSEQESQTHPEFESQEQQFLSIYSLSAWTGMLRLWTVEPELKASELAHFLLKMRRAEVAALEEKLDL